MRFKLIVMPQAECRLADWDGVFDMVEARYPEIAPKIHRWRERAARSLHRGGDRGRSSSPTPSSRIPITPIT